MEKRREQGEKLQNFFEFAVAELRIKEHSTMACSPKHECEQCGGNAFNIFRGD